MDEDALDALLPALEGFHARFARFFRRSEGRALGHRYLMGLTLPIARKNAENVAERVGAPPRLSPTATRPNAHLAGATRPAGRLTGNVGPNGTCTERYARETMAGNGADQARVRTLAAVAAPEPTALCPRSSRRGEARGHSVTRRIRKGEAQEMTRTLITLLTVVMLVALVPTVGVATAATGSEAAVESCLTAAGLELATGETPTISGVAGIGINPGKGPLMPGDVTAGVFVYASEEEATGAATGLAMIPFHEVVQEGAIVIVYGEAPSSDDRSAIEACVAEARSGGELDRSAPPSPGVATVEGRLTFDNEPISETVVTLFQSGNERREETTDAEGLFAFTDVMPGDEYRISADVSFQFPEGGGECTTPGFSGGFSLADGGIVLLLESDSFAVGAGETVAKDITLTCG